MNNMSTKTSKEKCDHTGKPLKFCNKDSCDGVEFVHKYHCGRCNEAIPEPVSEGKECDCKEDLNGECYYCGRNMLTPPSNALRSEEWEEDFDQQFLQEVILDQEVRTVVKGIKLFITKLLTSERQREYLRGCKDENIISKDLCELARADERKKMGELIKKLRVEIPEMSYIQGKDEEFYRIAYHEQTLRIGHNQGVDAVLAIIIKHQDK